MISRLATFAAVGALAVGAGSLRPDTATLAAWNEFVSRAENDLHSCQCDTGKPQGKTYEIPGGTIHQWRGELLVKGVTVDEVVNALQSRGVPPPQEDVLESRVVSRSGESVVVYLKLSRQALITVTYDTEHAVTFNRLSPTAAESRSIATRIDEADGRDHGFLWRLNSYWRYEQEHDGVRNPRRIAVAQPPRPDGRQAGRGPDHHPHRTRFDGECARGRAPLPGRSETHVVARAFRPLERT